MYVNVIYKEYISPITNSVYRAEIIEVDADPDEANKYIKLYGLQIPLSDRGKIQYRILQIPVS